MERIELRDQFLKMLDKFAEERSRRQDRMLIQGEKQFAWVFYERGELLASVNEERRFRGKPPATWEQIGQKEKQAFGHSDYASKYALYCADLVLDLV